MVREKQSARPRRKAPARRKPGSIWDTPRVKKVLAQPVGSPVDLTPEEMLAILRDVIENPRPYDEAAHKRAIREFRKIRRESGALLVRPRAHD